MVELGSVASAVNGGGFFVPCRRQAGGTPNCESCARHKEVIFACSGLNIRRGSCCLNGSQRQMREIWISWASFALSPSPSGLNKNRLLIMDIFCKLRTRCGRAMQALLSSFGVIEDINPDR